MPCTQHLIPAGLWIIAWTGLVIAGQILGLQVPCVTKGMVVAAAGVGVDVARVAGFLVPLASDGRRSPVSPGPSLGRGVSGIATGVGEATQNARLAASSGEVELARDRPLPLAHGLGHHRNGSRGLRGGDPLVVTEPAGHAVGTPAGAEVKLAVGRLGAGTRSPAHMRSGGRWSGLALWGGVMVAHRCLNVWLLCGWCSGGDRRCPATLVYRNLQ
mmetsp:Transcript_115195/g.200516  ORF Transcript_115195/g.200516 Transcript_115195/m.200516 type:complete len:215 (-) Transcript_115195:164-808(-)